MLAIRSRIGDAFTNIVPKKGKERVHQTGFTEKSCSRPFKIKRKKKKKLKRKGLIGGDGSLSF